MAATGNYRGPVHPSETLEHLEYGRIFSTSLPYMKIHAIPRMKQFGSCRRRPPAMVTGTRSRMVIAEPYPEQFY